MFALLIVMTSAHYYLGTPRQVGGYGYGNAGGYGYGMIQQPTFDLDARGLSVFTDGIDAKPAAMFIAAGMDPKFLPMMTDGVDAGDQWIYGLPGMTKEQVIARAKSMYPMSAQYGHPENEELMPTWGQIVANGLTVTGTQVVSGQTANSGTVTGTVTSDPVGTVVLNAGLYTVLSSDSSETSAVTADGAVILTPGTYRFAPSVVHYGEEPEEFEHPEYEGRGLMLSRPHYAPRHSYYHGCAPEDWVIGVGCVQNLRMRTPFLSKPQWRRKL